MHKNDDPIQLKYLRIIRDMALLKRMSSLMNAVIESFFLLKLYILELKRL